MNALIASFCIVFFRAMQSQNVIYGRYKSAIITSYLLAVAEVGVVLIVVDKGWHAVPWIGTGGALGVTCAMYAHRRWMQ